MGAPMWLIWSIEHSRWWKPGRAGYTQRKDEAGRYSFRDACKIVADANKYTYNTPQEAMIHDGE